MVNFPRPITVYSVFFFQLNHFMVYIFSPFVLFTRICQHPLIFISNSCCFAVNILYKYGHCEFEQLVNENKVQFDEN